MFASLHEANVHTTLTAEEDTALRLATMYIIKWQNFYARLELPVRT